MRFTQNWVLTLLWISYQYVLVEFGLPYVTLLCRTVDDYSKPVRQPTANPAISAFSNNMLMKTEAIALESTSSEEGIHKRSASWILTFSVFAAGILRHLLPPGADASVRWCDFKKHEEKHRKDMANFDPMNSVQTLAKETTRAVYLMGGQQFVYASTSLRQEHDADPTRRASTLEEAEIAENEIVNVLISEHPVSWKDKSSTHRCLNDAEAE